jgi:hypothetical protein
MTKLELVRSAIGVAVVICATDVILKCSKAVILAGGSRAVAVGRGDRPSGTAPVLAVAFWGERVGAVALRVMGRVEEDGPSGGSGLDSECGGRGGGCAPENSPPLFAARICSTALIPAAWDSVRPFCAVIATSAGFCGITEVVIAGPAGADSSVEKPVEEERTALERGRETDESAIASGMKMKANLIVFDRDRSDSRLTATNIGFYTASGRSTEMQRITCFWKIRIGSVEFHWSIHCISTTLRGRGNPVA